MDYKAALDRIFKEQSEQPFCPPENKLQFLGNCIFDFTTYDSGVDELFATKMIEVIDVILNQKTFEYQETESNYLNYLTMVNMPFLSDKIEWGTSIRGAWFDEYGDSPSVYSIGHVGLLLPRTEIKEFMNDLLEWSKTPTTIKP